MDFLFSQTNQTPGGGVFGFLPFILIMFIIYFLMIRPQMKQQRKKKEMLQNLKKGDRVVTAGGILGTIAGFKDKDSVIVLNVAKNVTLHVTKSSISGFAQKEVPPGQK
ncbi:MAG: preprotein translocase subunit YajC [Candidatus Neomarinimicrobiota bacterium]